MLLVDILCLTIETTFFFKFLNYKLVSIAKNSNSAMDAHKKVIGTYRNYILDQVDIGMESFERSGKVKFNSRHFDCPVKFLKYCVHRLETSPLKEYAPLKEVKALQKEVSHQTQIQSHKQHSKDFGIEM